MIFKRRDFHDGKQEIMIVCYMGFHGEKKKTRIHDEYRIMMKKET